MCFLFGSYTFFVAASSAGIVGFVAFDGALSSKNPLPIFS
jgi:hypothetical protein